MEECWGPLYAVDSAFPVLVSLDHVYVESDEKVQIRLEKAKEIQEARQQARKNTRNRNGPC